MRVKRIVTNIAADPERIAEAKRFYGELLGLDVLMDLGWIATYGAKAKMSVQVSIMTEGGSGMPVPDLSIEVDDLDAALERVQKAGIALVYGPATEPWNVRRFYVRDPFGKLVKVLQHLGHSRTRP
jgi:catechol 2,3-dioxygenase-like lactoylglutathione lyase family enzyme